MQQIGASPTELIDCRSCPIRTNMKSEALHDYEDRLEVDL
jgi:hypothetical protein